MIGKDDRNLHAVRPWHGYFINVMVFIDFDKILVISCQKYVYTLKNSLQLVNMKKVVYLFRNSGINIEI